MRFFFHLRSCLLSSVYFFQSVEFCGSVSQPFSSLCFCFCQNAGLTSCSLQWGPTVIKKGSVFISLAAWKYNGVCMWVLVPTASDVCWDVGGGLADRAAWDVSLHSASVALIWDVLLFEHCINSFNNFCRQMDRITTMFVKTEKKAAHLKTSPEFSFWYSAICLKNWGLPSST